MAVIRSDNVGLVEAVTDIDKRALVTALDEAIATSGMTQAAYAAALGTSGPRLSSYRTGKVTPSATFLLRAVRVARSLRDAHQKGWMTAGSVARAISDALVSEDEMWAYKMALQGRDHLHELLRESPELSGAWETVPASTGSPAWDAFVAALTAHEFSLAERAAPAWTAQPPLADPWVLDSPRLTYEQVRARTPRWLAERGIFVTERDLSTL